MSVVFSFDQPRDRFTRQLRESEPALGKALDTYDTYEPVRGSMPLRSEPALARNPLDDDWKDTDREEIRARLREVAG